MPQDHKGTLKSPSTPGQGPLFRGSASVLKPHHMTRYIYPSLCGYPVSSLRLQTPVNSTQRSRPQGSLSWGTDGHTFLTITRAYLSPLSKVELEEQHREEKKGSSSLGLAMARVTKYAGNTVLESGKFSLKGYPSLVYVIKRKTSIVQAQGEFGIEEKTYIIECDKWRSLMPPTEQGRGHDSWWMRLHVRPRIEAQIPLLTTV